MDALGDDLLARTALAAHEHRGRAIRRLGCQRQHIDDLATLADVVGKGRGRLLRAQELLLQILRLRGDLGEALHEVLSTPMRATPDFSTPQRLPWGADS